MRPPAFSPPRTTPSSCAGYPRSQAEVVATARARRIEETALRDARAAGYLDDVRARLAGLPPTVRPEVARALLDLALAVRLGATDADVAGLEGA
ncbi:MAG: hypothetical protein U0556_04040 [Dehalococcoidia bacterium]